MSACGKGPANSCPVHKQSRAGWALSILLLAGCGTSNGDATAIVSPPVIPDIAVIDGQTWTHLPELTSEDTQALQEFFQRNPGLSGSPAVEGEPEVFTSGGNLRRYYWIRSEADKTTWFGLSRGRRGLEITEGAGTPWQ